VDQSIGEHFGVFARYGRQSENVGVDYQAMASLGLSVKGGLWGRSDDHAGFGYAWLDGGNGDIETSHALEAYVSFALTPAVALTLDIQYMRDDLRDDQADRRAWIPGARLIASF
jgi:porin